MININIQNYTYKNKLPILEDVNFQLEKCKITSIIGKSGCGKSTLLRILMGIENGAKGSISFNDNHNLNSKTENISFDNWNAKQNVFSLVPQTPHLLPWYSVLKNIMISIPKYKGISKIEDMRKVAMEALSIVQLEQSADKYPHELSVGMAQRVAFARALVLNSQAILLDEPFSSLDGYTKTLLQNWLLNLVEKTQKYVVLVTHDIREALFLSQKIHILNGNPASIKKTLLKEENNSFLNVIEIEQEIMEYL